MSDCLHVAIQDGPLSLDKAIAFVDAAHNGAACLFAGRVRDHSVHQRTAVVQAISYDIFVPLAQKALHDICVEARAQFGDDLRIFAEHRKGRLDIGGISVVIAVGSPHRDASFKACRHVIEQLKLRVPIWKKEHYQDGDSAWLGGQALNMPPPPA